MKKRTILYSTLFVFFLLINFVSANFVCGEVEYKKGGIPSWLNVNVYYSQNISSFTNCKVSPESFKYCCDPLEIKNVNWQKGKEINSRVFDVENGYFSNISSVIISGQGYDVFPKLYVEKGIEIEGIRGAYMQNMTLNITLAEIFNGAYYNISNGYGSNLSLLCDGCNRVENLFREYSFGRYSLELYAFGSLTNHSEKFNFSILEYINFNRFFECNGCNKARVSSGEIVKIELKMNLSHESKGVLIEYIPVDWTVISGQIVEPFSESHNRIFFEVEGKEVIINYTVISPRNIFSREYIFQSSFEDIYGAEQRVKSSKYKFLDLFSLKNKMSVNEKNNSQEITFLKISPHEPLVYHPDSDYVEQIAIFVLDSKKNLKFRFTEDLIQEKKELALEDYKSFSLNSNINKKDIEKMLINFKFSKVEFEKPSFYIIDENSLKELKIEDNFTNENFSYYIIEGDGMGEYIIKEGANE